MFAKKLGVVNETFALVGAELPTFLSGLFLKVHSTSAAFKIARGRCFNSFVPLGRWKFKNIYMTHGSNSEALHWY